MKLSKLALCLFGSIATLLIAGCGATVTESISGTVTGLSGGTTLVLTNNGGDPVSITANGSFTFSSQLESGATYNVAVQSNPTGETCTVSNATGSISSTVGAVTNIAVSCTANLTNYNSVSGTVTGLPSGKSVTLLDNGAGSSAVTVSTNGTFSFPTELPIGSTYVVTVETQPTGGTCSITNASGAVPIVGSATTIVVTCN